MVMDPRDVAYAYAHAYAYAYLGASEMQRQSAVGPRAATISVSSYSVHTCVYSQSSPGIAYASLYFGCFVARFDGLPIPNLSEYELIPDGMAPTASSNLQPTMTGMDMRSMMCVAGVLVLVLVLL